MSLSQELEKASRVTFHERLSRHEVEVLVTNENLEVLQCSEPVEVGTWQLLNEELFSRRPDVELRIYGFYSLVCDLSFTSLMTNVRRFSADCLHEAVGFEHLAAMRQLESLGVGVYNLTSFDLLSDLPLEIKDLFLGSTKSKQPDLAHLARFTCLQKLYLEGQQKSIEVLSELSNLQDVTLRSISTPDISYLQPLDRLWSLDIKLGGIRDLSAIQGKGSIKYLELWRVRGLSDLSVISSLAGLQYLYLQTLSRVATLPSFHNLGVLRRVHLDTMRGLEDVSALETAPALEESIHYNAGNMEPEDYLPLLRNKSLKRIIIGFGSDRKNRRFAELVQGHGLASGSIDSFVFA